MVKPVWSGVNLESIQSHRVNPQSWSQSAVNPKSTALSQHRTQFGLNPESPESQSQSGVNRHGVSNGVNSGVNSESQSHSGVTGSIRSHRSQSQPHRVKFRVNSGVNPESQSQSGVRVNPESQSQSGVTESIESTESTTES